jgi:hypothetical protein
MLSLVADDVPHLEAWLAEAPPEQTEVEVRLNRRTAPWLLAARARIGGYLEQIRVHQPSHEHMSDAAEDDVRDPAAFFEALGLPVRVSGLPACLAPGTVLHEGTQRLDRRMFDAATGRLAVRELARLHVSEGYCAKSLRCADCVVSSRCDGIHINMIRDQGLRLARPLGGAWAEEAERQLVARWPQPESRVEDGRPLEAVASSLPGFAAPDGSPEDPVMTFALGEVLRREARRREVDGGDEVPAATPPK